MSRVLIIVFVSIQLILAGCSPVIKVTSGNEPKNVPIVDGKPPAAIVKINGEEAESKLGAYCWPQEDATSACVEKSGISTQEEPVDVSSPQEIQFEIPMNAVPTSLSLQVFPADNEIVFEKIELEDERIWTPEQAVTHPLQLSLTPQIRLELDPGMYVFALSASWDGIGNVVYGLLVEVH